MGDSKFIVIILAGKSALNASFGISRSLVEKGHQVIYTSPANEKEYVEKHGFPFHQFYLNDFIKANPFVTLTKNRFKTHVRMIRHSHAMINYIHSLGEAWIEQAKPDVVLLDSMLLDFSLPFLRKRVPIININCTLSTIDFKGRPPVFSSLLPANGSGPMSKLKVRMAWTKIFLQQHYVELQQQIQRVLALGIRSRNWMVSQVRKYGAKIKRTEYGLRLVAPEIFMGSRHLDFPYPSGNGVPARWYTGACVEETRAQDDFDYNFLDKEKKLVYCGMGTCSKRYRYAKNLYRCLFEAMEQLHDFQLVLQSEGVGDLDVYKHIPANVKIVERAPQLNLLKRASLFITHGGAGSTREGAYYGVPMIVFPGWHDQPGNAARVVYHHLGLRGDMKTITTKKLLSMIDKVMNDPEIHECAQKMSEKIKKDDERLSIIQLIESYSL